MKCNHCNSEVADGTNFCPNCGNRIEIPQPKICTHCGTKLEEGEKFCPNCGKPANDFAQPNQGQPQSSYQGQYQQPYQTRYQHPQLPQNPKLSFGEAINLASQRLTEANGRSRRSEYWWWVLAIGIVTVVLQFIPYVGSFAYIAQYFLLYAITMRRLHDCSAPEWVGNVYLGTCGLLSLIYALQGLAAQNVDIAYDIINWFSDSSLGGILIAASVGGLIAFIYLLKDSNPEVDPIHGPSPKYCIQ